MTLWDNIEAAARSKSLILDGTSTLSYRAVVDRAYALRGFFAEHNLQAKDRVAIAVKSDQEVTNLLLGCWFSGVVPLFIAPTATLAEARNLANQAQVKAAFVDKDLATTWGDLGTPIWTVETSRPKLISRLLKRNEDTCDYPSKLPSPRPCSPHESPDDALGLILYTSGTTGGPKLVLLTRGNLLAQARAMVEHYRLDASTRLMSLMSPTHVDGLVTGVLMAASLGSTQIRMGEFSIPNLPSVVAGLYKYRATHLVAPPAALGLILDLGQGVRESFDTEDFRFTISTASPLSADLWQRFEEASGKPVANLYGMSEIGNVIFSGPDPVSRLLGTIGLPHGCECLLVDAEGRPAEEGELFIHGPTVMASYASGPSPHREIGGRLWFPTGDLARRLPTGHLELLGRKKDIIIVGGLNVYPGEVDAVLEKHPQVLESFTLGLPDPVFGERVVSFVVGREGFCDASALTPRLELELSPFKRPREIRFVPELPKGRSGKVQREALLAQQATRAPGAQPLEGAAVESRVLEIASEIFRAPKTSLSRTTTPEVCSGWDSMAHLDLVQRLEAEFSIELSPVEVMKLRSLGIAIDTVRNHAGR